MADCLSKIPIQLKEAIQRNDGIWIKQISVPCGKCERCIERRKMEWSFRMANEMANSKTAYFVTLTYHPDNVPYTKYGIKTLLPHKDVKVLKKVKGKKRRVWRKRDDLTDYWKRLRITHSRNKQDTKENHFNNLKRTDKISYYAAGEYGSEKLRPHYHAIIFNASEKHIIESWQLGSVDVRKANEASITYVMKYLDKWMNKKQDWRKAPEFNTMSEGLGKHYIERMGSWHKSNLEVLYVTTMSGIMVPMPKYYRLAIFTEEERKQQMLYVENKLQEIKADEINDIGQAEYNLKQNLTKKYGELIFKKRERKRTIE